VPAETPTKLSRLWFGGYQQVGVCLVVLRDAWERSRIAHVLGSSPVRTVLSGMI
jgi:hypothetical protein